MRFLTRKPVKGPTKARAKAKTTARRPAAGKAKTSRGKRRGDAPRMSVLLKARTLAWGGGASLLFALAGSLAWAVSSGWVERQVQATTEDGYALTARWGLAVGEVFVTGRDQTARDSLLAALGVERGAPLLSFDPWAAQARVEALPWVSKAVVERRLPDTIFLKVVERRPLAVWQLHGRLVVIDQDGEIIPGAEARRFAALPLVVGEDAPSHTASLLTILGSEPDLRRKVTAAVRVGGRRWNIQLDGGIDVQLPESEPAQAWAHLADIEREHSVLQRDVMGIDLRLPDRLIIRTDPAVTIERPVEPGGEDT